MEAYSLVLLAAAGVAALAYAQLRLPHHTRSARELWVTRILLGVLGTAFGLTAVAVTAPPTAFAVLCTFVSGLGAVHIPAAFILALKRQRAREAAGPGG